MTLGADFIHLFNDNYRNRIPFLFLVDFTGSHASIMPFDSINPETVRYSFQTDRKQITNSISPPDAMPAVSYTVSPVCKKRYLRACRYVMDQQYKGESYLANLTFPGRFHTDASLAEIYDAASAPYKLYYKDIFTVFSPEQFVKIHNGRIWTAPMKGTIDAKLPDAKARLMSDPKECAEHLTVVDLLRNDLARVSDDVTVRRYRYVEEIKSQGRNLLQTSTCIEGTLSSAYAQSPGTVLSRILPAGSVTGAPKKRTVEIIRTAEKYNRGFYTGIFGCYDGEVINSAVSIRFIEKVDGLLYYKSGGGITMDSNPEDEYEELKNKIYVPVC